MPVPGSRSCVCWAGETPALRPGSWKAATAALLLLLAVPLHAAFVSESPTELFAAGDFDGDTRNDLVIVDKPTGNYRLAHQLAPGAYTWANPRASGVEPVTGLSVGRLIALNRDSLAFTSPEANRINLLDAASPSVAGQPVSVFIPSIGPNLVLAIDIGGANPARDDLFVASRMNGMSAHRFTAVRNVDGSTFNLLGELAATARAERGQRMLVKSGDPMTGGLLLRGATDTFRGYRFDTGVPVQVLELAGLAAGSDYVQGHFGGPGLSQFLFFKAGQPQLRLRPVTEPILGTLAFGTEASFDLGQPIIQVHALPGPSDIKLLVLFGNGGTATVYNFNGTNAPSSLQSFDAPEGELLTGAAVLADNGFMLLSGAEGRSTGYRTLNFNGASYTNGAAGQLPALNPVSLGANVLQFQLEPFVSASPNLLRLQNAGDWTSGFGLVGGPPTVSALVETFLGPAQGLDNPTPTSFGPAHVSANFGLVNQYADPLSLFSFSAPVGDAVSEVHIAPAPGVYSTRIAITFTTANPAHQVYYRLNNTGAWVLYNNTPIANVFTNTSVAYYAKPAAGDAKSIVRTAAYTFSQGPATLDSDNDGVPDYVEIANGLDALDSGTDGDADGFSDMEELLSGTDPADANDHPAGSPNQEQRIGFDLLLTPRPFDGVTLVTSLANTGALCRAYDTAGSLLSVAAATNVANAPAQPSALLTNTIVNPDHKLLVAATERHFPIQTAVMDPHIGRELVRLIPCPQIPPVEIPYVYGSSGGALAAEALGWMLAASNAFKNVTREVFVHDLTLDDALSALLVERRLALILEERGTNWWTNLTLFPFRPSDAGRQFLPADDLVALQSRTGTTPGYLLKPIHLTVDGLVKAPPNALVQALRDVTREIYRISSASNNAAPGDYLPPFDVLRQFIAGGALDPAYAAVAALPAGTLTDANNGVAFLLASVVGRPVTNLNLRVRPDSFTGDCTLLETANLAMNPVRLFDAEGNPYAFPAAFQLLPGSIVQVVGYADAASGACPGFGVEVISIGLEAVPIASDPDTDGNLLIDNWEKLFLAILGADAFGDFDGDGYSNLQEMFEGSDPADGQGIPAVPIANLMPPVVTIEIEGDGDIYLTWSWPEPYVSKILFGIRSTTSLNAPWTPVPVMPHYLGGGQFEATIPNPGVVEHFYQISLQLP